VKANDGSTRRAGPAVVATKATPSAPAAGAESFYRDALKELSNSGVPFLVAGAYAVSVYTGITRPTKDLDIFCKAGDYPRVLAHFKQSGYSVSVEDEIWIGKIHKNAHYLDLIFASPTGTIAVTDDWMDNARQADVLGMRVHIVGPTELVWTKCFIQLHDRYEGADVAHLILKAHEEIDWRRLLSAMEPHWEILLSQLILFRWIYPSERELVPSWLMRELMNRLKDQLEIPLPKKKICRGGLLSPFDYRVDIEEWDFVDFNGMRGPSDAS